MTPQRARLASVDALRGITVAAMLLVNDPGDWGHLYRPLEHASWHGCTPTDLIFPWFLFIVGVSIALAILPRLEHGEARAVLTRAALARALRIVLLGLAINALAAWLMPGREMRWPGVLQRIGICFALAAWLAIHVRPRRWLVAIAALLLGYGLLLQLGGTLEPWTNVASRLDSALFGRGVWSFDTASGRGHDPEGVLGTLPALATTLLGLCAGVALRRHRPALIVAGALGALALGWLWAYWQPFNKNLWTPSFALWSAGWAGLALALCHLLVDRGGWPALGRRFGVNAITAYAGSQALAVVLEGLGWQPWLYQRLFADWLVPLAGPWLASLAWALAFVALWWLIVRELDRRSIHLKL